METLSDLLNLRERLEIFQRAHFKSLNFSLEGFWNEFGE
jgi:hypothetical protein